LRALCLGSGACQAEDLGAAASFGIVAGQGWTLIAVNTAAMRWPGPLPHWATFHADHFPQWISKRHDLGLPPAEKLWSADRRVIPKALDVQIIQNWGGSSGMLAVTVALRLQAEKIVLCGIPLDMYQGHFDRDDKTWVDGGNYRAAWEKQAPKWEGKVRSMSGWTANLLGSPDDEWLRG